MSRPIKADIPNLRLYDSLFFDWVMLQVTTDEGSILINTFINSFALSVSKKRLSMWNK